HFEEVAPEPVPAFRTGVPVFVGFVEDSETGNEQDADRRVDPYTLTRWEQFAERVGRTISGSFLCYAVRGFFENGGEHCVVVPLQRKSSTTLTEELRKVFRKDERGLRDLLEDIEDVDLVCVPDIMMADIRASQETVFDLQKQVLEYCKDMGDRFAILDVLPMTDIQHAIQHWQELLPTEGALYFPWIKDRTGMWIPPCGHVAGIYARTDAQIGVHKAPANEIVEGALDLETRLTDGQQSQLNDAGVNCLRSFP